MDRYDVVVGIPSYNEANNIAYVAEMAGMGLQKYFPQYRSIIVNMDNNSPDNTRDAFLSAKTPVEKRYIATSEGVRGKGNNLQNLFHFVLESGARIALVLDADLKSVSPEWVQWLGMPMEQGYQYVCPIYTRNHFDGAITNHICYPLVFALLGADIRQPMGGDFAFSREMCAFWLDRPWEESTRHHGIDIFLTIRAISGGFRIAQAAIGSKVHRASVPKPGDMFEQIVYTLFSNLVETKDLWLHRMIEESATPQIFGLKEAEAPQEVYVDLKDLKAKTRTEYFKCRELTRAYLTDYASKLIDKMIYMDYFELDAMPWTQILYMLLHRFERESEQGRKEIVHILKPLCYSRALSFDYQTWRYNVSYSEECIRKEAIAFASQKPYLLGLHTA